MCSYAMSPEAKFSSPTTAQRFAFVTLPSAAFLSVNVGTTEKPMVLGVYAQDAFWRAQAMARKRSALFSVQI